MWMLYQSHGSLPIDDGTGGKSHESTNQFKRIRYVLLAEAGCVAISSHISFRHCLQRCLRLSSVTIHATTETTDIVWIRMAPGVGVCKDVMEPHSKTLKYDVC